VSDSPLVSIAVITYNHEAFIRQTLDSILSQVTEFRFEIVIGDDASSDKTPEIIREYCSKYGDVIVPVYRSKNGGGLQNILDLYSRCSGKYIAHLDGDDMMLPGKLQIQADVMEANPAFSICAHKVYVTTEDCPNMDGFSLASLATKVSYKTYDLNYLLLNGAFFPHCSKFFRRSTMPDNGFTNKPRTKALDWSFHVENAMNGDICFINSHTLGVYRKHAGGVTNCSAEELIYLRNGHDMAIELAESSGLVPKDIIRRAYRNHYSGFAYGYLLRKAYPEFVNNIEMAFCYRPLTTGQYALYILRKYETIVMTLVSVRSRVKALVSGLRS